MAGAISRRWRWALFVAGGALIVLPQTASASEGGVSFYMLGTGGPGAAMLPPLEGVFLDNTSYLYDGGAGASRPFIIGGKVAVDVDATAYINMSTALFVPSKDVLGGTLALAATIPVGGPSIDAGAVLAFPSGPIVEASPEDSTFTFGDPVAMATLSWDVGGNVHVAASSLVNIPIGNYRPGKLANLSFNRWALDVSTAISWHDPQAGWDVSAKTGVTFNGENDVTDYDTGTEWHLEASVERIFSHSFSAGLVGYHFHQLSGDSGDGATLGSFKGRVTALGGTAAYNFKLGKLPVTARLKLFEEFDARHRMKGTVGFLSLTMPLHVKLPPPLPQ